MNTFIVSFTEDTTIDQIVAGLTLVDPAFIQNADSTYTINVVWKTDRSSLANLKGRIETKSGRGTVANIKAM
jgi:hypothetical protein